MPSVHDGVVPGGAPPPAPPGPVWDDWPPSTSALLAEYSSREDPSWTLSGRRAVVHGTGLSGVREIRVDTCRIAGDVRLEVNGHPAVALSLRVSPDEIVRVLQAGEVQLTERITTALDHPLIFWSIVADAPVPIRLAWVTDPGDDEGTTSPLVPLLAEDGSQTDSPIRVGREDSGARFHVQPLAGLARLTGPVTTPDGIDALGFEVRSDRLLRLVLAAGADESELERALDALLRRKLRAFRQDRILHARRLEDRLVSLVSPDPQLDRAFGWAKVHLDGMLQARPHLGRYVTGDPVRTARAALAMGDRDIAREVLRTLRGASEDRSDRASLSDLAGCYTRWTGETVSGPVAAGDRPGDRDVAQFELTDARADPATLILGVIEGLWGIRPDALRGVLRVRPGLPHGWTEMALQRLRTGPTTLDLRLRRRPGRTLFMVRRSAGPPINLRVGLPERVGPGPVTIDEMPVGGQEVSFTTEESHEVVFHDE